MRKLILIAAIATLAGCSRPVAPVVGVAQETTGRLAGAPQSCISSEPSQNLRVLDPQTLAYGWGRTVYINRLSAACPGLEPTSTLVVERQGPQYCRGDRVRGREAGAVIAGPVCVLNDWVPYRNR
jgi:hypothetical protein